MFILSPSILLRLTWLCFSCPYVTAVGATTGVVPSERGANFSGGGFSNYFDTPAYQAQAVADYISALGDTNAGLFK